MKSKAVENTDKVQNKTSKKGIIFEPNSKSSYEIHHGNEEVYSIQFQNFSAEFSVLNFLLLVLERLYMH